MKTKTKLSAKTLKVDDVLMFTDDEHVQYEVYKIVGTEVSLRSPWSDDTLGVSTAQDWARLNEAGLGTLQVVPPERKIEHAGMYIKAREKRIAEQARQNTANHALTVMEETEAFRWYRFKQPETINCYFDVIFFPGSMLVQGDMGEFWWQRTHDMEHWARSSIGSLSYFAEKVIREIKTEEFDEGLAKIVAVEAYAKEINEYLEGEPNKATLGEIKDKFDDVYGASTDHEHAFREAYHNHYDTGDPPSVEVYTHHFLWVREGLRRVFKALDAKERMLAHAEAARFD